MSDLIKRQDAINAISTWDKFGIDERNRVVRWHEGLEPYVKLRDVVWAIEKLPSAQRNGHWILHQDSRTWECSECHKYQVIWSNYCMHCGADMRGEDDE